MSDGSTTLRLGHPAAKRRSERLQNQFITKLARLDHPATEEFILAVRFHDVDIVKKFLKSDLEIEYLKNSHRSALHLAVDLIETGSLSSLALESAGIKNPQHLTPWKRPETLLQIVQVIIESGRFNVNALTDDSKTVLHLAVGCCRCKSDDDSKHLVNTIIELLLQNNVNINAKTSTGETPLMKASENGCIHIVKLLLDWRDDFGAGVDLNARDIYGQTALIKAAKKVHVDVVDSLLKHGCLDEFQDNRGFYALHAAIYNEYTSKYAKSNFPVFMGPIALEETLANSDPTAASGSLDWTGNDSIQKTVKLLVTHGCAKVNAKDFRGNTVLDLALKIKHSINKTIVELLEEYGATSEHSECPRTAFKHTDTLGSDVALESEHLHVPQLKDILKLKRTINARDKNGNDVYDSLVAQGADEHIPDIDGKTPRDLKNLRDEEHKRHLFSLRELHAHLNLEKINVWTIWSDSGYAYRDQFSKKICDNVWQFMSRLSEEVGKKDPRFKCQPVLIGSAEEGTKIRLPDEFDFNFVLTKLSELCEVVPSPEAPSGFVHLKRSSYDARCLLENQHVKSEKEFAKFFNTGGFLLTTEIACRFRILYFQVLNEAKFWKSDDFFKWDPCSKVNMNYIEQEKADWISVSSDLYPSNHLCSTIQLKLNRSIEGRYMFAPISIDIVPCIKINGLWPEDTLSSLSDQIKCEGCHLVFDQPQRIYPWIPFSDPFARISFAPAESRMIKECSAVAKAAYMVGKYLICFKQPRLTYVLKSCLFYCIEALKDCTNCSLFYEDINSTELGYFVEKLMLCFHEFYLQDFLPCYMMPSFHLPFQGKFKSNESNNYNSSQYPSFVYDTLYRKVCTTKSPVYFCPFSPEPLNENFNREQLMRKLSTERSYIEKRRVYPRFFATGEMLRSDSQKRFNGSRSDCVPKGRREMRADKTKKARRDFTETK